MSGKRVVVVVGGMTYSQAVAYWATDSEGKPSVVIALPMADLDSQAAVAQAQDPDATAEELLDWLVDRIGTLGAQVLPAPPEAAQASRLN